jgi:hypothetical protein
VASFAWKTNPFFFPYEPSSGSDDCLASSRREEEMRKMAMRLSLLLTLGGAVAVLVAPAQAHVHGITPLITLATDCGVTDIDNTGANGTPEGMFEGVIPFTVGAAENANSAAGDRGRTAPVGCAR